MIWDIFWERNKGRSFQSYECLICIHQRLIAHCIAEPPALASSSSEGRHQAVLGYKDLFFSSSSFPFLTSILRLKSFHIWSLAKAFNSLQALVSYSPVNLWAQWRYSYSPEHNVHIHPLSRRLLRFSDTTLLNPHKTALSLSLSSSWWPSLECSLPFTFPQGLSFPQVLFYPHPIFFTTIPLTHGGHCALESGHALWGPAQRVLVLLFASQRTCFVSSSTDRPCDPARGWVIYPFLFLHLLGA